ncbi:hypothetical protein IHE44_0008673 [Lamprotornis superbus]|uniref:Ig-like domain-containing protein n=1 Tax=Lamprotornis superbus TaxID=245042 RepID=A0A835TV82_9PASS|nr:hypothetical protein IHE44_0008673 [Lamprotornis superbus]
MRAVLSGTPRTSPSPPSLAQHGLREKVRASSEVEEVSQGFARSRVGRGEAVGSVVALLSTCAWSVASWPKPKAFRSAARVWERSFPSLHGAGERGAAGGGKEEQMERLEEHQVAVMSLGHGDPDRCSVDNRVTRVAWLNRSSILYAGNDKWCLDPRVVLLANTKTQYSIQIHDVDVYDEGPYTCSVQTDNHPKTSRVHLIVQGKQGGSAPDFRDVPSSAHGPGTFLQPDMKGEVM